MFSFLFDQNNYLGRNILGLNLKVGKSHRTIHALVYGNDSLVWRFYKEDFPETLTATKLIVLTQKASLR